MNQPTKNQRSRVAADIDPIFIVLAGGFVAVGVLVISVLAFWALWNASPAVLKHVTHVTGALAPGLTFFAVLVAAIGWYVTAWRNGVEARRTEREKREIANEAVRDLVRARLKRIWEVIREAVSSDKPYNPDSIDYFLDEIQKNYWKVDTFAAFSRDEHALIRRALDDCQLDNNIATRMVESNGWNPGECFLRSLAALGPIFRDVFGDEELGAQIERTHDDVK